MLRQVRLNERVIDAVDPSITSERRVFAFGTHELALPEEVTANVSTASATGNTLRLIIDELLVGNNLEEIACRSTVDGDVFQRVPLGATPDDIARCSVADDVLPSSCTGSTAVCLCENPAGCLRGTIQVGMGEPVGVLDANQDGATDDTQFIDGAVGVQCGSIRVPIDVGGSYWNPSGDQNRPAMGGFDALGPAIVLQAITALPTNIACNLTFSPDIVDKESRQMCAPIGGDVEAGCEEGDMSAFGFKVEALALVGNSFQSGQTGIDRVNPARFGSNAPLLGSSLVGASITVKQAGANFTAFTTALIMPEEMQINWNAPGLLANTVYEITFTPGVTDTYAQGLPAPQIFTFTTGN